MTVTESGHLHSGSIMSQARRIVLAWATDHMGSAGGRRAGAAEQYHLTPTTPPPRFEHDSVTKTSVRR